MKQKEFQEIQNWMYRNARPLDMARWKYHFEQGDKAAVLQALAYYQNKDGGFGHAIEADAWNPNSSPIQTWTATEILRELGITESNTIVAGILSYLDSGKDYVNNKWLCTVQSNNDYPHAPWWSCGDNAESNVGYNPTACLAGFILFFAAKESSLYKKAAVIAEEAVDHYLSGELLGDMHESLCYIRLMEYMEEANIMDVIDLAALKKRLIQQVHATIEKDVTKWYSSYVCKPSQYFNSPHSIFYADNKEMVDFELDYIMHSRNSEGVWDISWRWGMYEKEFSISENWWKANLVILNMLFLKNFGASHSFEF